MEKNDFKNRIQYSNPEQQEIHEKFMNLLDAYQKDNSFENREFLCYLTAAIYLTYKKLFPQLSIYIPFRTKGDISYIKNIQKEFPKCILENNSEETFNITPIVKDISGIRIILDNINFSLPIKGQSSQLLSDPEIKELLTCSQNDYNLVNKIQEYIQSSIKNGEKYFEYKKIILERIINITPSEFEEERTPNPSFKKLYDDAKYQYEYFSKNDSFPTIISDYEINDLHTLLNVFRSRIDDKLHFAILRKTLPVVFEDSLIKNVLKTSFVFEKESKKENGFQAIYYTLETPFGPVEVQSQSNKAYYTATKGSAYHSGMEGKTINIKEFFELVDENDEHEVSYYLDILDSISADSMISPYEIPEFQTEQEKQDFYKTPQGQAYLESEEYRNMITHIQIKPTIQLLAENPSKNGTQKTITIDTNEYLFSTALSLSPYMNVCSSSHTSYTNAGIHHKKIIGEFAEVLRKKDSNTCLRDILIRRLEDLIEKRNIPAEVYNKDSILECLDKVKEHDEIANRLPKDISKKNIISYAEKLRTKGMVDSELSL